MNNEILLIVFVALTGGALLIQAIVAVAFFFFVKKSYDKARQDFEEIRASAMPLLASSKEALAKIAPQIEPVTADLVKAAATMRAISADVADITAKVRVQVDAAQGSADDVMERVRQQTARIDSMVTGALDVIDRFGVLLQNAVGTPARQLAGVLSAARAIVDSFRTPAPAARPESAVNESETFI